MTNSSSHSKVKTLGLFSLILILALLIFMPAKVMLWALPIEGLDTRKALIKGTWWRGSIEYAKVQDITLDQINWHLWPALLSGQVSNWQISWQDNLTQGQAQIAWPLLGEPLVKLKDLQAVVDVAYLPTQQAKQFGLLALYGKVNLQAKAINLSLSDTQLQTPEQIINNITLKEPVLLQTTDIYIESTLNDNRLRYEKILSEGTAEITQASQPGNLIMQFSFPEPVEVVGTLKVQAKQLNWDAKVKPLRNSPAWMSNLLSLFTSADGQNRYTLRGQLGL